MLKIVALVEGPKGVFAQPKITLLVPKAATAPPAVALVLRIRWPNSGGGGVASTNHPMPPKIKRRAIDANAIIRSVR